MSGPGPGPAQGPAVDSCLDVLIVGAGLGGLGAAIGLARAGHRVRVVDKTDPYAAAGAGLVLSPNGVRALDRLDPEVGRRVRAEAGESTDPFPYISSRGRIKGYTPTAEIPAKWGAPLVTIRRSLLVRLLRNALPAGVTLTTGRHVVEVTEDTGGVFARFKDGSHERAELLVGADGVWSAVRRHVDIDGRPRFTGLTSVRGITPVPRQVFPAGFFTQGPGVQIFATRLRDGGLYWAATINAAEWEWPELPPEEARGRLAGLVRDWHPPIPNLVADTAPDQLVVTDIHDMAPIPRWSTGRVTLLGDAAHPMAPFLGQGANTALEDAAALAARLRNPGVNVTRALADFAAIRMRRTTRVATLSRRLGRVGQLENRAAIALRDAAMRVFLRFGGDGPEGWLYGYEP